MIQLSYFAGAIFKRELQKVWFGSLTDDYLQRNHIGVETVEKRLAFCRAVRPTLLSAMAQKATKTARWRITARVQKTVEDGEK